MFFSVKINISTTGGFRSASINLISVTHNIKGFHVQNDDGNDAGDDNDGDANFDYDQGYEC